uniref:DUF2341 domain-containing protein n=1 Tax=Ignisphaera aggregans TaxID=334771 RepID=A0A7J2U2Q1_9CREN
MKMHKLSTHILLIIIVISVFSTLGVAPATGLPKAHAKGVIPGFRYQRDIIIDNTRNPSTLTDYQILVVVDTSSLIQQGKMRSDCGDIRFADEDGVTPLSYWVERGTCNTQSTKIWVKVPSIPNSSTKTIYMYYGNASATSLSNPASTFLWFSEFNAMPSGYTNIGGGWDVWNGWLDATSSGDNWISFSINVGRGVALTALMYESQAGSDWGLGFIWGKSYGGEGSVTGYFANYNPNAQYSNLRRYSNGQWTALASLPAESTPYEIRYMEMRIYPNGSIMVFRDGIKDASVVDTALSTFYGFGFRSLGTIYHVVDYAFVRRIASPEPAVIVCSETIATISVSLPQSVIYRHWLVYSPNSTQFTHSFTAINASAAGYTTSYGGDAWAWRVYANPYYSSGVAYPNTASLVSNVTVVLPYSSTNVYKLSLWVKTSATGSYRRLWLRVLNSAGSVVVEITNVSIGTSWTNVTVPLNINDAKVSIWINATVSSTTSVGEEIAVRGVKLFAVYSSTARTSASLVDSYYNCSSTFSVSLVSNFLNYSAIDLLLRDRLMFNKTTYTGTATYIGNETMYGYIYKVYRISNAVATGSFYVYSTTPNVLQGSKILSRGVETYNVLVGEPVTLVLPARANLSIVETGASYTNVAGNMTLSFTTPGIYTVIVNSTDLAGLSLGYKRLRLRVIYGAFTISLADADGKPLNYETLSISVKNLNTGYAKSLSASGAATLTMLAYGVHQVIVTHRGVPVCPATTLDLWIGTNGSILNINCNVKKLSTDYRGVAKSVAWDLGKMLLNATSLNARYPYAKIRYLINGSGAFKLVIDYISKPTSVDVKANVSLSSVNWDGNYLIISGTLGSVADIVVTDLYRLNVVAYDRLGNVLPVAATVSVNGTWYNAPAELLLEPATYIVSVPASVNGFQFYGYSDGYMNVTRAMSIASDVALKAFYRVPTRIETGAYQVMSLWQRLLSLLGVLQSEQYATVYIDGKVLDYYGNGVPNRVVTVRLYTSDGVLLTTYNITTDASGYFSTPSMELIRNATYRAEVTYPGDDIYINSSKTFEFNVASLPVAPAPAAPATISSIVMIVIAVAIIVAAIIIGIKIARKTVVEAIENEMSFVKKKRFVSKK